MDLVCTKTPAAELLQRLQMVPHPCAVFPCLDTSFSKYSHSNYAASTLEFPAIREIISERKMQINDIDTIIQQAEIILDQYREKRAQIVSSMKMHEGFISSIRHLPSEILGEIFIHCLPPEMHKKPTAQAAPLLLTGICTHWREVALDTPRLWCSLVIKSGPKQQPELSDSWLKRAKSCSLSLKLDIPSRNNPDWRKAILDFLQLHTGRLRNFTVAFETVDGLSRLFSDVPILERLCLTGDMETLRGEQAISIIQPQPHLRSLIIHSLSRTAFSMENLSAFNLGWTNLTRLALVLTHSRSLMRDPILLMVLQMCPNLEHLAFAPVDVFFHDNSVSFTHPKLRLLDIAGVALECQWGSPLLHMLTLPNLRCLRVRDDFSGYADILLEDIFFVPEHLLLEEKQNRILDMEFMYGDDINNLFTFLNPGWTTLTHIRIDSDEFELDIFFRVLALCPNLQDLVIQTLNTDASSSRLVTSHPVLCSLDISSASGRVQKLLNKLISPSLRHLNISHSQGQVWPHARFKAFLSRSQCPLETLKIKGLRISIEEREEFGSLIPTLMHVDVYDVVKEKAADVLIYSWSRQ